MNDDHKFKRFDHSDTTLQFFTYGDAGIELQRRMELLIEKQRRERIAALLGRPDRFTRLRIQLSNVLVWIGERLANERPGDVPAAGNAQSTWLGTN